MGPISGDVFIGEYVLLNVGFAAARARLGNLADGGVLRGVSEHAYREAITGWPGKRHGGGRVPAGRGAPS
jgi:hypothetical protein